MVKKSAGILLYRFREAQFEVFLVHPGGPFWAKKDAGAWSIPKGEFAEAEDPLMAAKREFHEETGFTVAGNLVALPALKQAGGKLIYAWAVEGNCDAATIKSNTFSMEWPPRSGKGIEVPEVDRAGWFSIDIAREKIVKGQAGLLDELQRVIENQRVE